MMEIITKLLLADRIFTFAYFIPTMLKLMNDESLTQICRVWREIEKAHH